MSRIDNAALIMQQMMNTLPADKKEKLTGIRLSWFETGEYRGEIVLPVVEFTFGEPK